MTATLRDLPGSADDGTSGTGGPGSSPAAGRPRRTSGSYARRSAAAYLAAVVGSLAATAAAMHLWDADLAVPFNWGGDAVSSAAHVKATMQWGWYENQPDLGAPFGQSYHDYPFGDNLPLVFAKVAGWFTDSWPVVFNLYFLLGFPLAAVTGLWFVRRCGVSRPVGVAMGILFAVAPYHWIRGETHYYLSGYWLVPVGVWTALTVLRGRGLWAGAGHGPLRRRARGLLDVRNLLLLVGLVALATSAAYYAVFTAVLIGVAGLMALIRTRAFGRFVGAAVAGSVLMVAVVLNILPDLLYARAQGDNPVGFERPPGDPEVYALKIVSLLLPAPGHRIPALERLRADYDALYPLPSEQPTLGFVAAVGLLMALAVVFAAATRGLGGTARPTTARRSMTTALSVLVLLMVLLSTVGGLGTILSTLSAGLRGWNRMSILIAIACLALTGLAVDAGVRVLARRRRPVLLPLRWAVAGLVAVIGVFDQSTSWAIPRYAETRSAWESDNAFVADVTATAGADAMLFQVPFMAYPESPQLFNALDSDVVKLSLLSESLRWSGGGVKGRPRTDWPLAVNQLPPDQLTAAAAEMGFTGVVLDSGATPDGGGALQAGLAAEVGEPTVVSPDGRWRYFPLSAVAAEVQARTTPQERDAFVQLMLTDPNVAVTRISLP
ncbi:hypothetical protein [Nakamurella deserti]|uniref:hypothetical protein n=1 Tax=Nakamurella deserti TaxID=2164074 RepID=UPI000DBE6C08|nr:hypothetical protein [Nakamurella deserti]